MSIPGGSRTPHVGGPASPTVCANTLGLGGTMRPGGMVIRAPPAPWSS